jgi:K+-transporting ATPase ATPase C chain
MLAHLRANLWLLILTVLVCSVLYPLVLLGIGQTLFRDQAEGSLILDRDGKTVLGSRLIAQPFKPFDGDQYFQPRPSAASYKADASGASNLAANNYLLRERVAQALGPIVKYGKKHSKAGQPVGPDIEDWLHDQKPDVAAWAAAHPGADERWLKADKANAALVAEWKQLKEGEAKPEDVLPFFVALAAAGPKEREKWLDGRHTAVQAFFFEAWRNARPEEDLEPVPADLVTTSGSGLDPHITLQNAHYQLERVTAKAAEITKQDKTKVRDFIEGVLQENAFAPLGGLAGVDLVNVLEVNVALKAYYDEKTPTAAASR